MVPTGTAYGAPAFFKPVVISQPDGSQVDLFVSGDEFYRYVHDEFGLPVLPDQDGWLMYVKERGPSPVLSSIPAGIGDPLSMGLMIEAGPPHSFDVVREKVDAGRARLARLREDAGVRTPRVGGPFRGTINTIVVFVRFAGEEEFTDDLSVFEGMFNATAPDVASLGSYYSEASYGRLSIRGHMFPVSSGNLVASYQDEKIRRYFQWANDRNPDGYGSEMEGYSRLTAMLDRAVAEIGPQVPEDMDLDLNNDGFAENVVFIVSGDADEWADVLWPHSSIMMYENVINGVRLFQYNLQFRDWLMERAVGVLSHEFFHAIGAPDLYHYSHDDISPAGPWDLMEHTQEPPQHMMAWMKHKYGFFIDEVPVVTEPGRFTINPLTEPENNCLKIKVSGTKYEYVMVEYRKRIGIYEGGVPEDGLLVYRVDEHVNGNASGPPDEVYIFRPGGSPGEDGNIRDAAFNGLDGRTAITPVTEPYLFRQDFDPIGIRIYDISEPGDTISFSVCPEIPDCVGIECGDDGCGGSCGSCDDGNVCTVDQCVDGRCEFSFVEQGTTCEDDNLCSTGGICDWQGVCVASVPAECVDGLDCTMDSCVDGGQWVDVGESRFEDIMTADPDNAGIDGDQFVVGEIPIGFDFPFSGGTFGWLKVFDNGLIQLSDDGLLHDDDWTNARQSVTNVEIPTADGLDNIVAVFWDDLVCLADDRCVVVYKTIGQGNDTRTIVQFNKIQRVAMPGRLFDFQVALFKDGRIELRYGDMGNEDGFFATIGFEGPHGDSGSQYSFNQRAIRSGMTLSFTQNTHLCVNRPKPGFCHINGDCVATGTAAPENSCLECRPLVDFGRYSPDDSNTCTDNNECTAADSCKAGVCQGDESVVCKGKNQCWFPGTCDPLTGLCDELVKDDGTRCNADNDGCTAGDYCTDGECLAGPPIDCSDKDGECAIGVCVSRSSNSFRCNQDLTLMAGQPCGDEADRCSSQDTCDENGVCMPNHQDAEALCRPSAGECDVPEYCDGAGNCPGNAVVDNGAPCGWQPGTACYEGACVPEPKGDSCEQAVDLVVGQPRRGSATHAEASGRVGSDGDCAVIAGPDVYYSVELEAGRTYTASVVPVGNADMAFGVIAQCGDDICPVLVNEGTLGQVESVVLSPDVTSSVILRVINVLPGAQADFTVSVVADDMEHQDVIGSVDTLEPVDPELSGSVSAGCSQSMPHSSFPLSLIVLAMLLSGLFLTARVRRSTY